MPRELRRFHHSGQSHFVTFSCYRRQPNFANPAIYDLFPICLEQMRRRFAMRVYGYVVMPEHVHLLVSEPGQASLADAMHYLKLSFSKRQRLHRLPSPVGRCESANPGDEPRQPFWQKRYYDRNVRDPREFGVKLRYLHRNPVKRGLVKKPDDWRWSSFRHYAYREMGFVEIESEWTARDRELKITGGQPRIFLSPAKRRPNLGHRATRQAPRVRKNMR